MMKRLPSGFSSALSKYLLTGAFLLGLNHLALANPAGKNYRTLQSGDWNSVNTWQQHDGTNWINISSTADIPDATSGTIVIRTNHHVVVTADIEADQLTINDGAILEVNSGVTVDILDDTNTTNDFLINGTLKNAGSILPDAAARILFNATGIYQHNFTNTFGTIPAATWNIASTLEFVGYINPTGTPSGFGQSFGNIKWNTANATADINLNGALTSNIRGNFEVVSTNGQALILSGNAAYSLLVIGDLTISNGSTLNISNGTTAGSTYLLTIRKNLNIGTGAALTCTNAAAPAKLLFNGTAGTPSVAGLSIAGNLNTINMDLEVGNYSTLTLNSPVSMAASRLFKVLGRLDMGTQIISGAGNFEVTGGILGIGSAAGITNGTNASGNVQVTGSRTFRANSTYVYNGSVAQVTGNGIPNQVIGLEVNNAAGLSLSKNLKVNGTSPATLYMTEGIISTAGYSLTVGSNGTVVMPAQNKVSYVNGALGHTVDALNFDDLIVFKFPVGKNGNYRPIELSVFQLDTIGTTYTAEQFEQAYTYPQTDALPGTIENISKVRYFRIEKSSNADVTAQVKLIYAADDVVSNYQKLTIAKYNSSSKWVDINATAFADGTIVSDFFDNFSDFVLANKTGGNNPLPVELLSFKAATQENATALSWETASEKNSSHFEVERSQDARSFESIGTVASAGYSQALKRYAFTDRNPLNGITYYRLKQVDLDGTHAYSKIEMVSRQAKNIEANLFPNPASGSITIALLKEMAAEVQVYNVLGQRVLQKQFSKNQNHTLDISHLPAGSYQLVLTSGSDQIVKKFLKTTN